MAGLADIYVGVSGMGAPDVHFGVSGIVNLRCRNSGDGSLQMPKIQKQIRIMFSKDPNVKHLTEWDTDAFSFFLPKIQNFGRSIYHDADLWTSISSRS